MACKEIQLPALHSAQEILKLNTTTKLQVLHGQQKTKIYRVIQITNDQWQLTCFSGFSRETLQVNWENSMLSESQKA